MFEIYTQVVGSPRLLAALTAFIVLTVLNCTGHARLPHIMSLTVILVLGEIWSEIQIRDMVREVEEKRAKQEQFMTTYGQYQAELIELHSRVDKIEEEVEELDRSDGWDGEAAALVRAERAKVQEDLSKLREVSGREKLI